MLSSRQRSCLHGWRLWRGRQATLSQVTPHNNTTKPPLKRSRNATAAVHQPHSTALGILQNGVLQGIGVLRHCHFDGQNAWKIAPLFADSPALAERLFLALKAQAPQDAPLFLDIPAPNRAALDLVTRHQMTPVFETARMYKGSRPDLPLERIFGVTSFELG